MDPSQLAALVATVVVGLVIASFSNVVIDRLPLALDEPNQYGESWDTRPWGEVLLGRSRCSSCGAPVKPWHNIPVVSYLVLRGKCRECGWSYGFYHLLIEVLVPIAGALAVWKIGLHPALILTLWLIPPTVAIAAIDFRTLMVPTRLVWPTFFVSVAVSLGISVFLGDYQPLLGALIGLGVLAGPLFVIWWLLPDKMGFGDIRLAVLLGWNLGYVALLVGDRPVHAVFLTLVAMVVACLVGLVIGGILQVGLGIPIPFGPGLVTAAVFCMIMAEPILRPWLGGA